LLNSCAELYPHPANLHLFDNAVRSVPAQPYSS